MTKIIERNVFMIRDGGIRRTTISNIFELQSVANIHNGNKLRFTFLSGIYWAVCLENVFIRLRASSQRQRSKLSPLVAEGHRWTQDSRRCEDGLRVISH